MTNASLMKKTTLLVFSVLCLSGCTTMSERRHLHAFQKSFHYKTYRYASDKVIKRTVAEYTKTTREPIDEVMAHALMGIVWFIADKSDYSFIEADHVKATGTDENRILAAGLQSIALSKMQCPRLARAQFNELKTSLSSQKNSVPHRADAAHKMMLISLIAVSLYQDDLALAKGSADSLGAPNQLDYLSPFVGAVIETKKGNPLKAMEQLQALSQNDTFSEPKKKLFAESAALIKNCPEDELHGQELVDMLILQLVKGALDDVFSDENQQAFLKKITAFSSQLTQKKP